MSITVKSGLDGHKLGYPKHRKTGKFTVPEKSAVWAYTPCRGYRGVGKPIHNPHPAFRVALYKRSFMQA